MMLRLPHETCLFASICNATPGGASFALWMARGGDEFVIDLSDVVDPATDTGLTGLAWRDGVLYCAVQSGRPRLILLDRRLSPIDVIENPAFNDLHSLHVMEDALLVTSTGNESLLRLDPSDRSVTPLYQSTEERHINSACTDGLAKLICYHGRQDQDHKMRAGEVMSLADRTVFLQGLGMPHSLMPNDDGFIVLDSVESRVIRFDSTGVLMDKPLVGFLRGAAIQNGTLFVASSTIRYVSRSQPEVPALRDLRQAMKECVRIYVLDAGTLEVQTVLEPTLPGFEIYDLLAVNPDTIEPSAERLLRPSANAISQLFYYESKRAHAALNAAAQAGAGMAVSDVHSKDSSAEACSTAAVG